MSLRLFLLPVFCIITGIDSTWISSKTGDRPAPLEEVNVLMFGALQFSQSLRVAYDNTDAEMARIMTALSRRESALQELYQQTDRAREQEKQMKSVMRRLREQMDKQYARARMTKDWLIELDEAEAELLRKVRRMEAQMNDRFPGRLKDLKVRAAENTIVLKGLRDLTQFQRRNIESHDEQLHVLQQQAEAI